MLNERDEKRREATRKALLEEEAHYKTVARVFGSPEGLLAAEWLLDVSGYWARAIPDERSLGKFELGRMFFDHLCMADIAIAHSILDRRRKAAEAVRVEERNRIEKGKP